MPKQKLQIALGFTFGGGNGSILKTGTLINLPCFSSRSWSICLAIDVFIWVVKSGDWMRPYSTQMWSSISRTVAPSRLRVKMVFLIILTISAALSTPRDTDKLSGSRYEGIPLLINFATLPNWTAFSRYVRVSSGGTPYFSVIVEQIRSSPGRCFCPLILRMVERRFWTISSSRSSESTSLL